MIMKTIVKLISVFAITLFMCSCATVTVVSLQSTGEKNIEIYTTKLPSQTYSEIKFIQVSGSIFHGPDRLLKKLTERAKKEGADAVINVKYDYQFWWPNVSGTLVKYN